MNFQSPNVLWGLLALSIPIIIHIFNFRRLRREVFSNVAFLKNIDTQSKSFLKLKHRLILASRLLFLASLILAFAQPYIPSTLGANSFRNIFGIYIDNSPSMQTEIQGKAALDLAIKKVNTLLSYLPKNSKIQYVNNDFGHQEYKSLNASNAKDQISKTGYSGMIRSAEDILNRLKSLMSKNSSAANNSYMLLSDFQKSSMGNLQNLKIAPSEKLYLAPISQSVGKNIFVDSVWLNNPFIRKGQKNGIFVKLKNSGAEAAKNVVCKLSIGAVQIAAVPSNIEANGQNIIHFDINIGDSQLQRAKISLEDNPIVFDNEYFFCLAPSPRINVLHLKGLTNNNYIGNAFKNDSLFNYAEFPVNNVDYGQIKKANLLIINAALAFNQNLQNQIWDFTKNGGSVLLIPSKNADLSSYNATFNRLGISNIGLSTNSGPNPLAELSKSEAFFQDIFENTTVKERLMMPTTSQIISWRALGSQILKTKGGQNFLTISKAGKANISVLATALDNEYGNFAQNSLFVPILYKIAANSLQSKPLAYSFDQEYIKVNLEGITEKTKIVFQKDKTEFSPAFRLTQNEVLIEIPNSEILERSLEPGIYDVLVDGKKYTSLALNHAAAESKIDSYSVDELKSMFQNQKNIEILEQDDIVKFAEKFRDSTQGQNFWKYLIALALLFLAAEVLVTRYWK